MLTRTNTVTGVDYRDDKAILCWETGNELAAPHAWTHEIAAHIKELDPNHLLMDGYYAIDPIPVREEAVADPMIDIVSSHHYVPDPELLRTLRPHEPGDRSAAASRTWSGSSASWGPRPWSGSSTS